jgi:hypothetical protein
MVKLIRLTTWMLLPFMSFSQTHHFDWALSWGGSDSQQAKKVTTDNTGNTYVLGEFNNSGDFDPSAGTFPLNDFNGGASVYLSKFDGNGTFIWAKLVAAGNASQAIGLATDASGNVYYCGSFSSTVDFNPGSATNYITSTGNADVFFSKIDASGNYVYTKTFGGGYNESPTGIYIANNNLFISGQFTGTVDLDPSAGTTNVSTTSPNYNAFVSCFALDGTFNWGRNVAASTTTSSKINDLTIDASGNIYLTGSFNGTCNFNATSSTPVELTSMGSGPNAFVSKWSGAGNFVWTKQFGTTSSNGIEGKRIRVKSNVLYIAGNFDYYCYFDMSNTGAHNLLGSYSGFLCKLDTDGNNDSEFNIGAIPTDMEIDQDGNVFVEGVSGANNDADPGPGTYTLPSYVSYITFYGSAGNFLGAKTISAASLFDFTVTADNSLLTVGYFSTTVDFNTEAGTFNLTSGGSYDAFLHKLKYCASLTQGVDVQTACGSYTWIDGNTYTASNNTATYTLTNSAGCDSIVTLNLTIATVTATITPNANGSLTASSGQSYQWINCATNTPISGQTGQTFTPVANGNYAVIVTSSACSDTSACFAVTNLGLEDVNPGVAVMIYPNPSADGRFTLATTAAYEQLHIRVSALDGKTLLEEELHHMQEFSFLIEGGEGIYLLEVSAADGSKSIYRIIKSNLQ